MKNSLLFLRTFPDNTPKNQYFCKNHAKITITKSLLFPVIIISNTVKSYNSATKNQTPRRVFYFLSKMCRDEKHPKRGFDPQAQGGITPVRAANEPRAARAQRMANPRPSATKYKHAPQGHFFVLFFFLF